MDPTTSPGTAPGDHSADYLASAKERGWRDLAPIDAAYEAGEITAVEWHAAVLDLIEPAYLIGDNLPLQGTVAGACWPVGWPSRGFRVQRWEIDGENRNRLRVAARLGADLTLSVRPSVGRVFSLSERQWPIATPPSTGMTAPVM